MMIYEQYSFWLMLGVIQFAFTFFCIILEIIQIILFMTLLQVPLSIYYSNNGMYKGEVKIWYDIVLGLSIISLGYYFAYIKKLWEEKKRPSIIFETTLFLFWFSSGIANLYPMYGSNEGLICSVSGYDSEVLQHQYYLWCRTYVISIFLGWMNTFAFFVAILLSLIILGKKKNNETIVEGTRRDLELQNIPTTNNTNNSTNNNTNNTINANNTINVNNTNTNNTNNTN